MLHAYCERLDAAGFNCLAASTGGDALQTGLSYRPQFAILQTSLADVQGTDVALRLKQETEGVYVILLGPDQAEHRFVGQEIGADLLLAEPVDAATLVAALKAMHEKIARSI
jgi:DNA-binding response OmpR family regulator